MAVWEYSMYGQLTTKITAAVLATVIVVALLVPVVMSVSTEYTSAYNSGQRYSTDIDGEHQIGIAKSGVSYEITTDGNANPSPTFIDTDVDPDPQQSVQPTPSPSRSPLRGEPVRATQTWTSGDCTCTLDDATGVFTVSGSGAMQDYTWAGAQPWVTPRQKITSLVVEPGVTKIGKYCFQSSSNLVSVDLGTVTSLEEGALQSCTSLESITIPATVTSINRTTFSSCTNLSQINVDAQNQTYSSQDGILFDKNKTTLIRCPPGTQLTTYTIPSSVTSIGDRAFSAVFPLTAITIPSSVTSISEYAFGTCTSLTSITFEATTWNITTIGNNAFNLGGSSGPMVTATVYSPNNVADGQLDAYKGGRTTLIYSDLPKTVTITVNDPTYGSVDVSSIPNVPSGTSVSVSGNILTIGTTNITATAQSGYRFASWSGIPASGTITEDVTITAVFQVMDYTVTITVNDPAYGTVDVQSLTVQPNTAVSASGNVLTVGTTPITATPAQATAQYTYAFGSWGNVPSGGTITSDVTITANFTATVNQYTVTVNVNEPTYGTVSPASVTVDYGTSISASGNVLTIGSNTVTQTPTTATAQYTYSFDSWTGTTATVTGDMAVTANFTRATNDYTVTITVNDANYGSVSQSSVTVPYGTAVSTADNVLTIGSTDVTQTPASPTQQYRYAFGSWQNAPQTVTADVTVTAVFTQSPRDYIVTVTVNDPAYGTVDVQTVTVDYGASISAASNVLTVGSTDVTATANQATAQYTFAFSSWSGVPAGGTVTDDITVTAVFTATVNEYHVHIQVNDARQGSVDVSDLNVPYGTTMTVNGNVLTINTSPATVVTASVNAPTAQYTFQFTDWVNVGTVTGDVNVVARYTVITNEYTVTFAVNDSNYGYVTEQSIIALYGTSVTVDGNSVSVGPYDSTAYANDPTVQYTYAFVDWTGAPETVTGDVTITANFTRTVNQYTVQIVSNNTDYGTVDTASVTVDYGTSVTYSSNVLTVGSNTITATPATSTPQWTYVFSEWQNVPQAVTGNVTVTAVFTATHLVYTVTFVTNGGTPVTAQEVEQGQTAVRPADPYLFSYYLVNWYSDDALTTAYNFATPVTGDTIVYQGYAPDRYSLVAYGSDGLVVLFDRSGALVYVGGGDGNVRLATITQGSSYNLVLTDGEFTAGEETATVTGFVHPRGNLAYGQNQWMNADSPFGVFGVLNTTTSGGADIGFSYAVTGIIGNHEDAVVEQSYGDKINAIECAQEIVDGRVNGATVSIVTENSDSASYTDAYILAPYEIRTYNPDYVGDTLATLLMAIAVFCVLGIIAMVGYNRVKG